MRAVEGREAIGRRFAAAAGTGLRLRLRVTGPVVHDTGDPEVVIAEFDHEIRAAGSDRDPPRRHRAGRPVRDGLVAASRDHHDHAALAEATRGHRPGT